MSNQTIEIHSRAKKGGQFGANGEWYEGGKFINTVAENAKRHKQNSRATRKQQVESYKWEVAPEESMIAIFPQLAGVEIFNRTENTFKLNPDLRMEWATPEVVARREVRIAAYNAGERWVKIPARN